MFNCFDVADLTFNRAGSGDDHLRMVAKLIYGVDEHIYPAWRPTAEEFADFIVPWMNVKGFIFHRHNICVARKYGHNNPLGILISLDTKTSVNFDYSVFKDEQSQFVFKNYLSKVVAERQSIPDDTAIIIGLCVDPLSRNKAIASELLSNYIERMRNNGVTTIRLDCLVGNAKALRLYKSMGFEIIGKGFGFNQPSEPPVEIYTLQQENL